MILKEHLKKGINESCVLKCFELNKKNYKDEKVKKGRQS